MPSRFFQDYNQNNPITSLWLNGINNFLFGNSTGNAAQTTPLAWVRFNGSTGAVIQSYGVNSVTRNSAGNYTIMYTQTLAQATNCYSFTSNLLGFSEVSAETANSVTLLFTNTVSVPTDPTIVNVLVFGTFTPNF